MRLVFIPPLCNGSISDFDSESVGSSPAGGAIWESRQIGKAAFRHCLDQDSDSRYFLLHLEHVYRGSNPRIPTNIKSR